MAPRIGFTMEALRRLHPASCDTDVRLVWKAGDPLNVAILQPRERHEDYDTYLVQRIRIASPRELRLLGLQLIKHADDIDRPGDETEVALP